MALLLPFSPLYTSISLPSSSCQPMAVPTNPGCRLQRRNVNLLSKSSSKHWFKSPFVQQKGAVVVRASSEIDGTGAGEPATKPPEELVSVENLPLESKQQMILEQRLKMKLAKKIRLRRKRLVRKRKMRKKGRWPPSKMKKNKNV